MFQLIGRNAASLIFDLQLHPQCAVHLRQQSRAYINDAIALWHGIKRIQEQVQENLFDLLAIKGKKGQLGRQGCVESNASMRCRGRHEAEAG